MKGICALLAFLFAYLVVTGVETEVRLEPAAVHRAR